MPYRIVMRGGQHCVAKTDEEGGEVTEIVKCHDDEGDAEAHMRALYANVEDAGKSLLHKAVQILDLLISLEIMEGGDGDE